MPKFNSRHRAFNPGRPYWLKPQKSDSQRRRFAKVAEEDNTRRLNVHAPVGAEEINAEHQEQQLEHPPDKVG